MGFLCIIKESLGLSAFFVSFFLHIINQSTENQKIAGRQTYTGYFRQPNKQTNKATAIIRTRCSNVGGGKIDKPRKNKINQSAGKYRATRSVSSRLLSSLAVVSVCCPFPAPLVGAVPKLLLASLSLLTCRCRLASSSSLWHAVMNLSAPVTTTCTPLHPRRFFPRIFLESEKGLGLGGRWVALSLERRKVAIQARHPFLFRA